MTGLNVITLSPHSRPRVSEKTAYGSGSKYRTCRHRQELWWHRWLVGHRRRAYGDARAVGWWGFIEIDSVVVDGYAAATAYSFAANTVVERAALTEIV